MFLHKITLLNFKNHENRLLSFNKKINCIIGNNGVGKTNLLDAIYYLCLTKSYFNSTDQQNILFGRDFFRLEGKLTRGQEPFDIVYKLAPNKRKELIVNDTPIPRLSEHIGNFPAIIISPDDSQLILGSSEERRRFLDNTISQVNHEYLDQLIAYNKVLAQRNAALKRFAETRQIDRPLIETYDQQITGLGNKIYEARRVVIGKLYPIFQRFYKQLSFEREAVSFTYSSQLNDKPFDELLKKNFDRDVMLQRTDVGIHKDDIEFFLSPLSNEGKAEQPPHSRPEHRDRPALSQGEGNTNSQPGAGLLKMPNDTKIGQPVKIKRFGSQGQQKSFIISIKFAQYDFIRGNKDFKPFLLIDDIFDKLDNDRSQKLVELIAGDEFGQVFLTDTDDAHIREVLKGQEGKFEVVRV